MAAMTTGRSSRADANRRRILDVALAELLRDPDASMERIARAAGVVRRTVYGHFPSREALIGALVDGAVEEVATAHAAGREGTEDLALAVAGSVLALWEVADRYRLLVELARRGDIGQGVRERLAPVRAARTELLRRGLDEGVFVSPLPAPALAHVHERMMFAVMEAVHDGLLDAREAGRTTAVTVLTAAGIPASLATVLVAKVSD
ncbi:MULTISPECIES: TetR/AcrR family transcriptional regulator [unclassified Streptomyces]|uniref:TetR/AcrR family transcriptional regulator n=1 Tax=unclassified Streptomyces TaxID=2593676 RepID=UPI000F50CF4A|nr:MULTISPECIES: TetR/AcrR family transcriptional regulator [unclassified Streptomyces]MDH6452984.1 AcrR family transcriptional regulator [Streptomyces sp. SAI-119]MDH6496457.1 AcrR family transcriptional regulator [Streptomyces sp. SAI-149]QUC56735.1 TetR/AcrR family transcriptional regulator [Streptomyces sp. A2-16]